MKKHTTRRTCDCILNRVYDLEKRLEETIQVLNVTLAHKRRKRRNAPYPKQILPIINGTFSPPAPPSVYE